MNILERIGITISANINALISRVENPVATLEKLVQNMEGEYQEARTQVARAIADEKKLTLKCENAVQAAKDWDKKAALRRQKEQNQLAEVYSAELGSQRAGIESLKSSLKALEAKIDEARRKKNILAAKHQRAKTTAQLQQTMTGIGGKGTSSLTLFEQAEARIEDLEAQAAAAKELGTDDVEAQFAQMSKNEALDDELAALKERMKNEPAKKDGGK
jgi:phage shock protein A